MQQRSSALNCTLISVSTCNKLSNINCCDWFSFLVEGKHFDKCSKTKKKKKNPQCWFLQHNIQKVYGVNNVVKVHIVWTLRYIVRGLGGLIWNQGPPGGAQMMPGKPPQMHVTLSGEPYIHLKQTWDPACAVLSFRHSQLMMMAAKLYHLRKLRLTYSPNMWMTKRIENAAY